MRKSRRRMMMVRKMMMRKMRMRMMGRMNRRMRRKNGWDEEYKKDDEDGEKD